MPQLSPRQQQVFDIICTRIVEDGCSPSYAEIARELGVSDAYITNVVTRLVALGYIEKTPNTKRALRIRGRKLAFVPA